MLCIHIYIAWKKNVLVDSKCKSTTGPTHRRWENAHPVKSADKGIVASFHARALPIAFPTPKHKKIYYNGLWVSYGRTVLQYLHNLSTVHQKVKYNVVRNTSRLKQFYQNLPSAVDFICIGLVIRKFNPIGLHESINAQELYSQTKCLRVERAATISCLHEWKN